MDENTVIQMTPTELDALVEKATAKAAEKAAADLAEKNRQEMAQRTVPETIKTVTTEPLRIKVADASHRLGTLVAGYGKARLEGTDIESAFKSMGLEPSQYFNPERVKNQSAGSFEYGGALINEAYDTEFLPLLKAKTVFRNAGIQVKPMLEGQLIFREGTDSSTAYWRGEAQKRTKSEVKFGQKRLTAKFLDAMVVASDQSLRYATVDLAQSIEDDMMTQLALKEDWTILYGTGTEHTPKGLFYAALAANKNAISGSTAATRKTDLVKCRKLLAAANVDETKRIWVMHPTNRIDLETQVDSNTNPMDYSRTLSESGKLFGAPVYDTTQAYSSSAYNTFYIELSKIFIAQSMGVSLKFNPGGQYIDSNGDLQSGQVTGESTFTCSLEEDIGIKYTSAFSIITGTTWGT